MPVTYRTCRSRWCAAFAGWLLLAGCSQRAPTPPTDTILLEGVVTERSVLPAPATSPYPDALFTAEISVHGILEGDAVAPDIAVAFPGFRARVLEAEDQLMAGDAVRLQVRPFEAMDEATRNLQQSDTLTRFDLDLYYAMSTTPIDSFSRSTAPVALEEPGIASIPENPQAVTHEERMARNRTMELERARIHGLMAAHANDWEGWYSDLAPYHDALRRQLARCNGYQVDPPRAFSSIEWLDSRFDPTDPAQANMIDSLDSLNQGLRRYGIDLIVAFLPERDAVWAPHFLDEMPEDHILQPYRLRILKALLDRDIEAIDMLAHFRGVTDASRSMYYYSSLDVHPADGATMAAAELIAQRLARYDLGPSTQSFVIVDQFYQGPPPAPQYPGNRPPYRGAMVLQPDHTPFAYHDESPVMFMGDSFLVSPNDYGMKHGDVARHLARLTGHIPAVFIRRSGTPIMNQFLARMPRPFFTNRKVFVFYASFHNLTGAYVGAWRNVNMHYRHQELIGMSDDFDSGIPHTAFTGAADWDACTLLPEDPRDMKTSEGWGIFQSDQPRRLTLPEITVTAGQDYIIRLNMQAAEYETWRLHIDDHAPKPIQVLKGPNRHFHRIRPDADRLRIAFDIPFGTRTIHLQKVEICQVRNPAPGAR